MPDPLLAVRHVARRFGRRAVLLDASLSVKRGELVAVTGENGAGKSTLLRVIAGLLAPDAGAVRRRGRLGYCPQEALVFDRLRVAENFRYFAAAHGIADRVDVQPQPAHQTASAPAMRPATSATSVVPMPFSLVFDCARE